MEKRSAAVLCAAIGWFGSAGCDELGGMGMGVNNDSDANGNDSDTDVSIDVPPAEEIVSEFDLVERQECETVTDYNGNEQPVAGATTYWVGEFDFDGNDVWGFESWVLFANDAWAAADSPGYDCQIVWTVAGQKTVPSQCGTCDYALEMSAVLDLPSSTCDEWLVNDMPEEEDLFYNVYVSGDEATFYFTSGTELGTGTSESDGATYLSDYACAWF